MEIEKRLKLPTELFIDRECIELLKYHLCSHLCEREKIEEYKNKGISIIVDIPLKVIYNHKYYWTAIVKDKDNQCYWYVRPYHKSYYMTKTDEHNTTTFDKIIQAIIDNDTFSHNKK